MNIIKNNNILNDNKLSKHFKMKYLLNTIINDCTLCNLYKTRKNIVLGEGNLNTEIIFIGEAPGKEEDISGIPFVGNAGILLNKIILAMKYQKKDIYISNVIKCRPLNNATPTLHQLKQCKKFIEAQIFIIKPKIIITLGRTATNLLLNKNYFISKVRGNWHMYNGILLMPTFHPAFLLRNPNEKIKVWNDLKIVLSQLKNNKS